MNHRYIVPTSDELRVFKEENGLTGAAIAAATGVHVRTVRKWLAPENTKSHRQIPWAAWIIMSELKGCSPETVWIINSKQGEIV